MASKGKGRATDLKQEEILQAVVIADSFNVRFAPITDKKPRALLPLINVPMIDYILDFLYSEKVQETFVFCCHHADQIRAHIRDSKWGDNKTRMSVKVLLAQGSRSMGDALREIDSRSLIRNDFFLLNCETIANVDLKELMAAHRLRRETIKSSVLTMHCMKYGITHKNRCSEDNILLGVEPDTMRILHYERMCSLDKKIRVPSKHPDMTIHQNLLDSQLYICSPLVLHLFTDNFDYSTLEDFIRGVIINEEIFGNTMHVNVLTNGYCCRITNPYMYDMISHDIMRRMSIPITPQLLLGRRTEEVLCQDFNIYKSKGCKVASSVTTERNVVVGKGSTVGGKTYLADTVIGENCKIGASVRLSHCYVWDNVTIEDNCTAENAIICDGVIMYANTHLQQQTILSWNVKVGPDVTLPEGIRLQDAPMVDEFEDEEEQGKEKVTESSAEYGSKSQAFPFTAAAGDSDDEDNELFSAEWGERFVPPNYEDELEDSDDASEESEVEGESEEEMDDFGSFYAEVRDTLKRAKKENITADNLILEVNGLKHAFNIAIKDVHQAVVKLLVEIPLTQESSAQGKELLVPVLKHVQTHMGLLKRYIKNRESQMDCLHTLEDFALENERVLSILSKLVHNLYNRDVLEEDVIVAWYRTEAEEEEEEDHRKVRKEMEEFITWLEEAEEESDDD